MEKPVGNVPEAGDNLRQDPCLGLVPTKDLPSLCLDIYEGEKATEKGAAMIAECNECAESAESELTDVSAHVTDAAEQSLCDISNSDSFDGQTVHVKEVERRKECIVRIASKDIVLWSLNGQIDTSPYKKTSEAESKAIKKRLQTEDTMSKYMATLATPMSGFLRQNIPEQFVDVERGTENKQNKDGLFNRFIHWVGRKVIWTNLRK